MRSRIITAMFFIGIVAITVAHGQGTISVTTKPAWHRESVDNAHMNRRIADAAEQYKEYAPISRIAFYDIGFPKDNVELKDLNGYAVLLVSALSQDESELPIRRVYVNANGKEIELKRIKEVFVRKKDLTTQEVKTFGQFRVDALYLFPVHLRFGKGQLLVDFTRNRVGMRLVEFDGTVPANLKALQPMEPVENQVVDEALKRFMKREYPGYSEKN